MAVSNQPRETTHGYFADAEQLKDFVDYLFDVEKIDDYKEVFERFLKWQDE